MVGAGLWPTRGTVRILGETLGRVDMRALRTRITVVSASVGRSLRPAQPALDVVLTGRHAALETWWHEYSPEDHTRASRLLAEAGFGSEAFAARPFGQLSEGERQQVLLSRALMGDPELILMDEPAAGLDLGARERLLGRLATLAGDPAVPPLVLVTHHLEELPPGVTHAALLRSGPTGGHRPGRRGADRRVGVGRLRCVGGGRAAWGALVRPRPTLILRLHRVRAPLPGNRDAGTGLYGRR